ncbi:MAG: hypothetical protein V9E99_05250 [Microthrixaceae bacterium]
MEVAVIVPALLFLMLLVVYAGKVSEADGNVERALQPTQPGQRPCDNTQAMPVSTRSASLPQT